MKIPPEQQTYIKIAVAVVFLTLLLVGCGSDKSSDPLDAVDWCYTTLYCRGRLDDGTFYKGVKHISKVSDPDEDTMQICRSSAFTFGNSSVEIVKNSCSNVLNSRAMTCQEVYKVYYKLPLEKCSL